MWPARGIDTNSDLVMVKTKQFQRQHFNIFHWLSLHIPSVAGSRWGQTVSNVAPVSLPLYQPLLLILCGAPKCYCPSPSVLGASTQGHPATPYATRWLSSFGCGRALGCSDKDEKDAGVPIFRGNQAPPASWPRDTYLTLHIAVKCLLASSAFGQSFFP